jgi:hypothetical protein
MSLFPVALPLIIVWTLDVNNRFTKNLSVKILLSVSY